MTQVVSTFSALLLALSSGIASGNCVTDTTQADFQAGVASNLDFAKSPGNAVLTSTVGGGVLDQQNTTITLNGEKFNNTQWAAQSFTARNSGPLSRVDVNVFDVCGVPPPPITMSIRATSNGLPTGPDLATTSFAVTTYTGAQKWYTANFTTPANISSGTQYAIVLRASGTVGTSCLGFSNSANSSVSGNDVYSGGVLSFSTSSGSSWAVQTYGTSPTSDAGFKTFIGAAGGTSYSSAGDLISTPKDGAPPAGSVVTWSNISWIGSTPTSTQLRFQAAASNSATGVFSFVGPDGTAATYFTSGASLDRFSGNRFLKYRAFLTTDNVASTPTLSEATVCYSISTPPSADLSITNTDGVTTAAPGNTVTYSIKASNAGPSPVTNATVSDNFPASLTCNWTCSGANGGTCKASGSGDISDATVDLASGASVTYSATCAISASATGSLSNTATVTSPVADPNTANNTAIDLDSLSVTTNVAVTMSDSVELVRIGDVITYLVEVTNINGPSNASATVTDTLPSQLNNGSWVCTAINGASCGAASGNGNKLTDSPTLPNGSKVDYLYTATVVAADSSGGVSNTVSVRMNSGGNQAQANLTASDSDTVVLFASGFDSGSAPAARAVTGGGGSMTLQFGVDAGLLQQAPTTPVTVASGQSASGRTLFSLQLVRLGSDIAMRTLTTIDDTAFSDVSAWTIVNLQQHRISLDWRSASAHGDDGFLRVGTANTSLPLVANNARENLAQVQVAVSNEIPWLVAVQP